MLSLRMSTLRILPVTVIGHHPPCQDCAGEFLSALHRLDDVFLAAMHTGLQELSEATSRKTTTSGELELCRKSL